MGFLVNESPNKEWSQSMSRLLSHVFLGGHHSSMVGCGSATDKGKRALAKSPKSSPISPPVTQSSQLDTVNVGTPIIQDRSFKHSRDVSRA